MFYRLEIKNITIHPINLLLLSYIYIEIIIVEYTSGTKHLYKYIRSDLKVPFHRLGTPIDRSLSVVHTAIKTRSIDNVVYQIFEKFSDI